MKYLKVLLTILILLFISVSFTCNKTSTDSDDENGDMTLDFEHHEIDINGISREYRLYTPDNWTSDEQLPLIFMFYGSNGDPHYLDYYSGMSSLGDEERFFVVYPYDINSGWDLGKDSPDIDLLDQLIPVLINSYNIDKDRIYAAGFSLGGFLVHNLGCALGDRLAGIGSVCGEIQFDNCDRTEAVDVIIIHGTDDTGVEYRGEEDLEYYRQLNSCTDELSEINISDEISCSGWTVIQKTYSSCENDSKVRLLRVKTNSHGWFCFASRQMWKFFNE